MNLKTGTELTDLELEILAEVNGIVETFGCTNEECEKCADVIPFTDGSCICEVCGHDLENLSYYGEK